MTWAFLLLCGMVFAQVPDLEKMEERAKKKAEELQKTLKMPGKEEIEREMEKVKPIVERSITGSKKWEKRFKKEGDRIIFLGPPVAERDGKEGSRRKEKAIYVFMSSSVPEVVWKRYAHYIDETGIPAVLLLRGCVGGCRRIRPTLEFIAGVLELDGEDEEGLRVEVQIDPRKFRKYGVKVVPCVAVEGRKELSCGDWSLEYHLRKLGVEIDGEG